MAKMAKCSKDALNMFKNTFKKDLERVWFEAESVRTKSELKPEFKISSKMEIRLETTLEQSKWL